MPNSSDGIDKEKKVIKLTVSRLCHSLNQRWIKSRTIGAVETTLKDITILLLLILTAVYIVYGVIFIIHWDALTFDQISGLFKSAGSGAIALWGISLWIKREKAFERQLEIATKQAEVAAKQSDLAESKRLDDRFKDAISLLGNPERSVRIGAIYILHEIARSEQENRESPYPPQRIAEILCGFIRNQSQKDWDDYNQKIDPESTEKEKKEKIDNYTIYDDIQTALNLLSKTPKRKNSTVYDGIRFILDGAHLERADLINAHLEGAYLYGTHLEHAYLFNAHLEGAHLFNARLERAVLEQNYRIKDQLTQDDITYLIEKRGVII